MARSGASDQVRFINICLTSIIPRLTLPENGFLTYAGPPLTRYEDLSVEPYARTQELLGFYGLPFDAAVEEFLDSHTRSDVGGVSSTFRDSRTAPFHWMGELSWREVQEMQSSCGEAMRLWGYAEASSRMALRSRAWSPLGNVTGGL